MKTLLLTAVTLTVSTSALGQTSDALKAKIDRDFAAMDANRDGQVSREEYARTVQTRSARQAGEMDAAFGMMDKDKDGQISQSEAAAIPVIASAFGGLDADGNGTLSRAELQAAFAKAQTLDSASN